MPPPQHGRRKRPFCLIKGAFWEAGLFLASLFLETPFRGRAELNLGAEHSLGRQQRRACAALRSVHAQPPHGAHSQHEPCLDSCPPRSARVKHVDLVSLDVRWLPPRTPNAASPRRVCPRMHGKLPRCNHMRICGPWQCPSAHQSATMLPLATLWRETWHCSVFLSTTTRSNSTLHVQLR